MIWVQRLALLSMMALVFIIPVDGLSIFGRLPLLQAAGLLAFGFTALLILCGSAVRGASWFIALSILYVSWIVLSFIWTSMPVDYDSTQAINSQQSVWAHLYLLGMVLLLFQIVYTEDDIQWLLLAFLLGSLGLITLFLVSYSPNPSTVRHALKGRDANEMSVQLAMVLPVALYLMNLGRFWWMRVLGAIYLPLAIVSIFATGSRTGFIVLFIGLLGLLPLLLRSSLMIKLLSLGAMLAGLLFIVNTIPAKTFERMFTTGSELTGGTLNERSITWQKAWQEWQESPLVGHGLSSFRRSVNKHNVDYTAHNSFISIAVEQGVVGLILYLLVIMLVLYYAIKLDKRRRLLMLSMALVVVTGQMALTLHENMYVWFAYVVTALMLLIYYRQYPDEAISAKG